MSNLFSLKKILLSSAILAMTSSLSFAMVRPEQAVVGGVSIHTNIGYVRSVYGEPTAHYILHNYYPMDDFRYGSTVRIIAASNGMIFRVSVTGNNGWHTPDGINVGMNKNIVYQTYGKPDEIYKSEGKIVWNYYANRSQTSYLSFYILNDKVCEIAVGTEAD